MSATAEISGSSDRLAIHELAVRYCDATTRGDWAAFEALWMPDGVWVESAPFSQRFVGVEEICRRSSEMLNAQNIFIQICHGVVIDELTGSTARAHATVQGIARGPRGSSINYVIFKDSIVKSDGVWRYAYRDLHNIYVDVDNLVGQRILTRDEVARIL